MTEIRVDTIVDAAGTGAPNFTTAPTVGGVALGSLATSSFTSSGTAPSSPSNGAVWWDTANSALMIYVNSAWQTVTLGVIPPGPAYFGDRMLMALGNLGASPWQSDAIKYFDITANSASASSFGNLSATRAYASGSSGEGRGLFAGGAQNSGGVVNTIEYVTIANAGNGTDFGDLTATAFGIASASDATTAIHSMASNVHTGHIQKVTIASTGNATSWSGTLNSNRSNGAAASDGTKGFFIGGFTASSSTAVNTIDYVTISTDANAADWGDLNTARKDPGQDAACGTSSRVLVAGGNDTGGSRTASIEYINPASASNAYSFGNLTAALFYTTSACNEDRAVFANGLNASSHFQQIMNYVQISSAGNAASWGNSGTTSYGTGSLSGAAS